MARKTKRRSRKGKQRTGGGLSLAKAIVDLKIATAINPTPRMPDVPRLVIKPKTYTVVQNYSLGGISTSNAAATFGSIAFRLSDCPLATGFEGIFDSWRIIQATVRFVPQIASFTVGVLNPPILTVLDYDDSTPVSSTTSLRAYDNLHEVRFGNYIERTLVPRIAIAGYGSGAFTSYVQGNKSNWVDVASPNVYFYGIKYGIDITAISYANVYFPEVDVVFQFKSVR